MENPFLLKEQKYVEIKHQSDPNKERKEGGVSAEELLRIHGITHDVRIKLVKIRFKKSMDPTKDEQPHPTNSKYNYIEKSIFICPHPKCYFKCGKLNLLQNHIEKHNLSSNSFNTGNDNNEREIYSNSNIDQDAETISAMKTTPAEQDVHCCPYTNCDFVSNMLISLQNHLAKIHNELPFECSVCSRRFKIKSYLQRHAVTHLEDDMKKMVCSYPNCEYRCHRKEHLKSHERIHTRERPYKCPMCKKSFSQGINLKRHEEVCHRNTHNIKVFECLACDYSSNSSHHLKRHIRTHTGYKPFKCTECPYSAIQSSDLKLHMMKHTGEKPLKCAFCQFVCARRNVLKRHIRTHTGERPYKCLECDYSAAENRALKSHVSALHCTVRL